MPDSRKVTNGSVKGTREELVAVGGMRWMLAFGLVRYSLIESWRDKGWGRIGKEKVRQVRTVEHCGI